MGVKNGANMLRVLGVVMTAALMADAGHAPAAPAMRAASGVVRSRRPGSSAHNQAVRPA
jgi:hypothetical protein